jgi:hypothetical protein
MTKKLKISVFPAIIFLCSSIIHEARITPEETKIDIGGRTTHSFSSMQCFPESFYEKNNNVNSLTIIKYSLPGPEANNRIATSPANIFLKGEFGSELRNVKIKVCDIPGREVATLVDQRQLPGNYFAEFSVNSIKTGGLPSDIYFYQSSAGKLRITAKTIQMD